MSATVVTYPNKQFSYRKQIARHVKIFLTSSLITMQNLIVVSHTECDLSSPCKGPWGSVVIGNVNRPGSSL